MNTQYTFSSFKLMFSILCSFILFSETMFSQVSITQEEFLNIFAPGSQHYYTPVAEGTVDIGKTDGPNVYDFSFIDLNSLEISYNYLISSIPEFTGYFPSNAITIGETPSTIENNPVFFSSNDSIYVLGEASNFPINKIKRYTPYELLGKFPTVYGAEFNQQITLYGSMFDSSWQLTNFDTSTSLEITKVDGYGTLKLSNGNYECIRVKKDHTGYGDKEYIYMTKEGVFLLVGGVSGSAPDTGFVAGGYQLLLSASMVDVSDKEIKPNNFDLIQNYPNPFNPTTKISYSIPKTSLVQLKVYNTLGKEIAVLVNKEQSAGNFEVEFNAKGLSSGIYFYRIQAGNNIVTKKMILMK